MRGRARIGDLKVRSLCGGELGVFMSRLEDGPELWAVSSKIEMGRATGKKLLTRM